jgi:hypothetical protein
VYRPETTGTPAQALPWNVTPAQVAKGRVKPSLLFSALRTSCRIAACRGEMRDLCRLHAGGAGDRTFAAFRARFFRALSFWG